MIPAELYIRGQVLQQAIAERCPLQPPAPKRASRQRAAQPIGDPVGLSFGSAARAHPELRRELIDAGKRIASSGAGDAILRDFLLAAGARHATAGHVEDGVRLAASARFRALDIPLQRALLRCYARLAPMPELRAVLVELVRAHALEPERLAMMARYLAGPERGPYSEPVHARTLERYWSSLAPELRRLSWAMSAGPPDEAVENYLHERVRSLLLLRPLAGGTVTIVFGDPTSEAGLSYAQRGTSLQSPGSFELDGELECRSAMLTRLEELELIRWIEQTHNISRRRTYRPSAMPYAVATGARAIDRMIVVVLKMLTARRGGVDFAVSVIGSRPDPSRPAA